MPTPALQAAEAINSNVPYPAARISLQEVEAEIAHMFVVTGAALALNAPNRPGVLDTLTVCTCVLKNGWVVIGQSAPIDGRNYSSAIGEQVAYQDAVRQIWPLLGYVRKQAIYDAGTPKFGQPPIGVKAHAEGGEVPPTVDWCR